MRSDLFSQPCRSDVINFKANVARSRGILGSYDVQTGAIPGSQTRTRPSASMFRFRTKVWSVLRLFKVRRAQEFFRICPGKVLADASVFISCAMVLSVFNVTKHSENGRIIEPVVDQTTGTIR